MRPMSVLIFNLRTLAKTFFSASIFVTVCLAIGLSGCAILQPPTKSSTKVLRALSKQKVFYATYDQVWRAAQLSLKYPMAINNMDNGILETEYINAIEGFQPPDQTTVPSSGIRYKISLTIAKGKTEGKEAIRVTVNKYLERKKDFFSEPETLESDGLEERVLLYRIDRELAIDEGLRKSIK
jgi:hypothetical protein